VADFTRGGEMQGNDDGAMDFRSINIDVRRALIDWSVIRIQGGLLNAATASVWRTVETEFRRSPELVALDLSEVTDIDAAGVGVLVAAAGRAGESDIAFCLVGAHEGAVGTALAEANLTELFEIFPAGTAP
jgi:anti-sigma B factor antagonist